MKANVPTEIYSVTDRESGTELIVSGDGEIDGPAEVVKRLAETNRHVTLPEDAEESGVPPDDGVEDKSYQELREMAMEADTDEINGRSAKDEIIAYFSE